MEYRNTPVLNSKFSPTQLLFSRLTKTTLPISDRLLEPKIVQNFQQIQKQTDVRNKRNYDKNVSHNNEKFFEPNQNIALHDGTKWGPAKIIKPSGEPRSYLIEEPNNSIKRRNTSFLKKSLATRSEPAAPPSHINAPRPKREIKKPSTLKDFDLK